MSHVPIPPDVEDGWYLDHDEIHFMERNGPIWYRKRGDQLDVGFLIAPKIHDSNHGAIHGGMIAAFADFALGHAVWNAYDRQPNVTVQLDINFVSPGQVGEWLQCTPEIVRMTRSLVFMRGDIMADDRIVATAHGVWKLQRS